MYLHLSLWFPLCLLPSISTSSLRIPNRCNYFTSLLVFCYSYLNLLTLPRFPFSHLIQILAVSILTQHAQRNLPQKIFNHLHTLHQSSMRGLMSLPPVAQDPLKTRLLKSYQYQGPQKILPVGSNTAANSAGTKRRICKLPAQCDNRDKAAYLSGTHVSLASAGGALVGSLLIQNNGCANYLRTRAIGRTCSQMNAST